MNWRLAAALLLASAAAHAQVSVSDGGSPTYSQAIAVPPGVAGMSPKIGLFYAGGGVNGPVGHGWSVQGMSVITRCPPSKAIDGARGVVNYTASDKLCLDGQRLIQTDTAGTPLAFPQTNDALGLGTGFREYRTEKDTYARIRAYGYASGDVTGASGPAYFKVWTKSGQIYEYGASSSADGNTKALIAPYQKTVGIAWAVARISDTLGNYMDFKYEQRDVAWGSGPTAGSPTFGHEWNLLEIQYSGSKVIFTYADRASTSTTPQDSAEAYHQGSKNVSIRRLQSITTYVNSPNTGTLGPSSSPLAVPVKTTKLAYTNGSISGRSLLTSIQECAGSASSTRCLPATSFTYAPGGNDVYQASPNFNLGTLIMQTTAGDYGVLPGDFNGDGKTDFIRWSATPSLNQLYLSNGDGSFTLSGAFNIKDQNLFGGGCRNMSMVGDFNGDGLPDILRYGEGACGVSYIYLNNGDGSFTRKDITGVTLRRIQSQMQTDCLVQRTPTGYCAEPGTQIGWTAGTTFYLLDVNGDGKLDVVTAELGSATVSAQPTDPCVPGVICTRVYIGDGAGGFAEIPTTAASQDLYSLPDFDFAPWEHFHVADVDGDGLADLASVGNPWIVHSSKAWRSSGDGNFTAAVNPNECKVPLDFNGDGRADCLYPDPAGSNSILSVSEGANNYFRVAGFNLVNAGQELAGAGIGVRIADINGDGRHDILRWKDDATQNVVYLSNGDGTFTPSATFNLNSSTSPLAKSDGTAQFVLGDFTGRGATEILRMQGVPVGAVPSNQLHVKSDSTPPDQLVSVTSGSGATTTLYYVPLSNSVPANGVSGSYGPRYTNDRGTGNAATGTKVDLTSPQYVVATSVADSGVGSSTVATEYSYLGMKVDTNGRGFLGFREVRHQSPGANGDNLTVFTKYLQDQPYIGVASRTETRYGSLNDASAQLLSSTINVYCDTTAAAGAETAATETLPCTTSAKVQRPYLRKSTESGSDLAGVALPQVITTNTMNAGVDPTMIVATTTGTVAGISQTFTKTTTNTYGADNTSCSADATCYWILGRLTQATVQNTVPNSLAQITTSAGTGANATATTGSGPTQAAVLTPSLAFGSVNYGSSNTLTATLANDGSAALTITVPTATSVAGADFSFVSTTCTSSLAAGTSCTIGVNFTPTVGGTRTGTLSVVTGAGTLVSNLSGIGLASKATLTSAATLPAAAVWYGAPAQTVTATYRNDGNAAMTLNAPSLAAPLSVSSNTCSNIAVGASCSIVVTVATNVPGIGQSQNFTPVGAAIAPAATTVTWTTYAAVPRWSPTSLDFGTVTVGASASQSIALFNDGNVAYDWAANSGIANAPAGYSFNTGACASVAPGASCSVIVTFTPSAATTYSGGSITMLAASYNTNTFSVTGTGMSPPPSVAISPASWNAGNQLDRVTVSNTFTVTNFGGPGAFSKTLTRNTLSGNFNISGSTCPANGATMGGASSCTVTTTFTGQAQCGGALKTESATLSVSVGSSAASASLTGQNHVYTSSDLVCQ